MAVKTLLSQRPPRRQWLVPIALGLVGLILLTKLRSRPPTTLFGVSATRQQMLLEEQYQQWLSTYAAADPAWQTYCIKVLRDSQRSDKGSQFSQDVFLFHNLYKYWPMQGKTGFYVESGANDATQLSNTLFFDKCLNWKGLCVEPLPQYHEALRQKRSCQLVPECISSARATVNMSLSGPGSTVGGQGLTVQCAPIGDMLQRYTNGTQRHIDLWVLDVEGHELKVLEGTDFTQTRIDTMMIEDVWLPPMPRMLDIIMGRNNFLKLHQLPIDSVFVRRGTPAATSVRPIWYPPTFEADLQLNRAWAKRDGAQSQLRAAWGMN